MSLAVLVGESDGLGIFVNRKEGGLRKGFSQGDEEGTAPRAYFQQAPRGRRGEVLDSPGDPFFSFWAGDENPWVYADTVLQKLRITQDVGEGVALRSGGKGSFPVGEAVGRKRRCPPADKPERLPPREKVPQKGPYYGLRLCEGIGGFQALKGPPPHLRQRERRTYRRPIHWRGF
jgi:hypothetical protein